MPMKPVDSLRSRRVVNPPAPWRPVITDVATRHRIHPRDMLCGLKSDQAVAARQELWWRLNRERGISLAEIGRRLGGFDHTTVSHGVKKWAARIQSSATPVAASPSLALESSNG